MSDRPRWLWITAEVVERERATTGGAVYSMELVRAVGDCGVDVTVVGLGGPDVAIPGVEVRAIHGSRRGGLRTLLSPLPNMAAATATRAMRDGVGQLLAERRWDVVVIDHLQVGWALPVVRSHAGIVVFVAHNHEASVRREIASQARWRNGKRPVLLFDTWKAVRLERRVASGVDVVTAVTDHDRRLFQTDTSGPAVVVAAPGWSGTATGAVVPVDERPRRVGMIGSFEWHAKQENLRRFLDAADPVFAAAGVEMVVGGVVPAGTLSALQRGRRATVFAGWVPDVAEFIGGCRIGVVAEPLGGGFKLKVLDYVFNDVVVAVLEGSVEGLPLEPGVDYVSEPTEEALADAIVELVDDPDRIVAFTTRARQRCAEHFSWERSASVLVDAVRAAGGRCTHGDVHHM